MSNWDDLDDFNIPESEFSETIDLLKQATDEMWQNALKVVILNQKNFQERIDALESQLEEALARIRVLESKPAKLA